MNTKEQMALKMLNQKLSFLPLNESLELYESGEVVDTLFWWVMNNEEITDNGDGMSSLELLKEYDEIFGITNNYGLRIGREDEEFDEFTLNLCPAPTYIDLIK